MNKKYERYIEYIVSDLELPYFKNMRDNYGLRTNEYKLVLSKVFNQPVYVVSGNVVNQKGNLIYLEDDDGFWEKREYDDQGNKIYFETSDGFWSKREYDEQGNNNYYEDSNGTVIDYR